MLRTSDNRGRLDYLDNIKSFLMCLVIMHHVVIAYGGEGLFIITAATKGTDLFNLIMTAILAINQSYFMGIFFVISSYFSYKSLKKKGKKQFIAGKLKRLLLPALIYLFVISPILSFIIDVVYLGIPFQELKVRFNIGALWFILALVIFDIIYALFFSNNLKRGNKKVPTFNQALLWVVFIGMLAWLVRIVSPIGKTIHILAFQFSHFPQYIVAYAIGIVASQNDWLQTFEARRYKKFLWAIIPLIIMFLGSIGIVIELTGDIAKAFGGFNIISLLYSTWEQLMFFTILFGLIGLFKEHFNYKNKVLSYMGEATFIAYIAHSTVIVFVVMILSLVNLNHILSFVLAVVLSISGSFVVGKLLKPVLRL